MSTDRIISRPFARTERTLAAIFALVAATPAMATSDFTLPEGCTPFLSVQSKDCSATLFWSCHAAPKGNFWAATFGADGLESVVSYSDSHQWLDSVYLWDSSREKYMPPATDPIDKTTLLDTGVDTYDFTMHRSVPDRSYEIRVTGADVLMGETTEIDGFTLEKVRTRVEITADDGTTEYKAEGVQFYSRALGLFFLGTDTVFGTDGDSIDYDTSPVDIIRPGEPGFGSTAPLYECTQQDAALTAPQSLSDKETDHDQI